MTFTAAMFKADDGASGIAPGEYGVQAPAPSPNGGPRGSMAPPDPQVTSVRSGLPGASGSMVPADPSNLLAHVGRVPGSEPAGTMAVPALAKARHPQTGRFTTDSRIAAGHPTTPGRGGRVLDQQPRNSPQFPDSRTGPQVGVPQPVTATPPNPHHVTGGPESEQLRHPPGSAGVQRLDLAAACSPGFRDGLAHPLDANPMVHIAASPAQHLGQTPQPQALTPDDIPTGPPDLLGRSAGSPLAGAISAHMGSPLPFGISTASASCGFGEGNLR